MSINVLFSYSPHSSSRLPQQRSHHSCQGYYLSFCRGINKSSLLHLDSEVCASTRDFLRLVPFMSWKQWLTLKVVESTRFWTQEILHRGQQPKEFSDQRRLVLFPMDIGHRMDFLPMQYQGISTCILHINFLYPKLDNTCMFDSLACKCKIKNIQCISTRV